MLRSRTVTAALFGLGLCSWTASALVMSGAEVLGHDEARYAVTVSNWLAGHPIKWTYVPYGMNLIAAPGIAAGGSPHAFRAVSVLMGIGFVLAAAHLARRVASARTAAWLVATLAGTASLVRRSAELLPDQPSALCTLVAIALLVDEIDRDTGPRWRIVWVAPLFAAAFYVRYGTCIPTAMIGVAVAAIGWRTIAARPAPAIATVALLAVLLVPHLAMAIRLTGSPLGILHESSNLLFGEGFAAALVTYTTSNPFTYFGFTSPVLVVGILSIVRIRDRRRALLWAIAILDIVALGLTPTPAVRYIVIGVALLALLGIDAIEHALAACTPRLRAWFGAVAAVALVAAWVECQIVAYKLASSARTRADRLVLAADAVRRDAAGAPCEVIGRHTAQLQWYSGCENVLITTDDEIRRLRVYVVIEAHSDWQPKLANLPDARRVAIVDRPELTVMRLDPP